MFTISKSKIDKFEYGKKEEKILFELETPSAVLNWKGETIRHDLSLEAIQHLFMTSFYKWKTFIIRTYFRLELNVSKPIPKQIQSYDEVENYSLSDGSPRKHDADASFDVVSEANDLAMKFPPAKSEFIVLNETQKNVEIWFG